MRVLRNLRQRYARLKQDGDNLWPGTMVSPVAVDCDALYDPGRPVLLGDSAEHTTISGASTSGAGSYPLPRGPTEEDDGMA